MELMPRRRHRSGFTLIEMVVALFVSLIVVAALGKIMLVNSRSWKLGNDKVLLQQNVSDAVERMAHSIRSSRRLRVISATEFRTYDTAGALTHTYRSYQTAGGQRLQEDGRDMAPQACDSFACTTNADTTSLTLAVQLQNTDGETVARRTRVTIRNRTMPF